MAGSGNEYEGPPCVTNRSVNVQRNRPVEAAGWRYLQAQLAGGPVDTVVSHAMGTYGLRRFLRTNASATNPALVSRTVDGSGICVPVAVKPHVLKLFPSGVPKSVISKSS